MEVRREVAGRELALRYTFNSICAVEERSELPLERLMERKFGSVRLLFWGALIDRQPDITVEAAGRLINDHLKAGGTLDDIAGLCIEALAHAGLMPEEVG